MEKRKFPNIKISIIVELNTCKHPGSQVRVREISVRQFCYQEGGRNFHIHTVSSREEKKQFLICYEYL